MRERKYVKMRVDMYEDTKLKVIDRRPERDLIHYVWNRLVLLAGKVNLEGDLYFSKSRPYSIETLAVEFNREASEIKLALDVLIELEMLEYTQDKVYRVTNFAKHQNIKTKEKVEIKEDKRSATNEIEKVKNVPRDNLDALPNIGNGTVSNINAKEIKQDKVEAVNSDVGLNLGVANSIIIDESNKEENAIPIIFDTAKKKSRKQRTKKDATMLSTDGEEVEDGICCGPFPAPEDGEMPLEEGESVVSMYYF
jgi:predicted phage replisome organizer